MTFIRFNSTIPVLAILFLVIPQGSSGFPHSSFFEIDAPNSALELRFPSYDLQSPSATPALWETIFSTPDVARFKSTVYHLASEIGPRPFGSDANEAAQEWLIEQFEAVGGPTITASRYGNYNNVRAILPGEGSETSNYLLLGAHIDTVSSPPLKVTPGANDDASGLALLLEAARVLRSLNLPATIEFAAFNSHHTSISGIALGGAREVAAAVAASGFTYIMGLDVVRILYTPSHPKFRVLHSINGEDSYELASASIIANMSGNYGSDTIQQVNAGNYGVSTDISPFPRGLVVTQALPDPLSNLLDDSPETYPDEYYENAMEIVGSVCSALTYLSFMNSSLDYDEDGLLDREEIELGTFPNSDDTDGDGLSDWDEVRVFQTNPLSSDTEDDGLLDYDEIHIYHTDPLDPDTDDDGLDDVIEVIWLGTSPLLPDTDGDNLTDFEEVEGISIGIDFPGADSEGYITTLPTKADTDNDGLADDYELFDAQTNPRDRDTDNDGYTDGEEVSWGSNPLDKASFPPSSKGESKTETEESSGFAAWIGFLVFLGCFLLRPVFKRNQTRKSSYFKRYSNE